MGKFKNGVWVKIFYLGIIFCGIENSLAAETVAQKEKRDTSREQVGTGKPGEEDKEEQRMFGIRVTDNQIRAANALADFLFSYKERHPDQDQEHATVTELDQSVVPVSGEKQLRVGVLDHCLPFCTKDGDRYKGFEVDLWELLAKESNLQFVYVPIQESGQALKQGDVDLVLGAGIAELREYPISDSYLSVDLGAIYIKTSKKKAGKRITFTGKRIGVIKDSFLEHYIKEANLVGAKIKTFDHFDALLDALNKDKEDFVLVDEKTAQNWIAKNPELAYFSLGVKREIGFYMPEESEWWTTISEHLKRLPGTQTFSELIQRWAF